MIVKNYTKLIITNGPRWFPGVQEPYIGGETVLVISLNCRLSVYLSASGWCEIMSSLLPREVDKLCVAVVTMMNLLDSCDFTQHHMALEALWRGLDEQQDEEILKNLNELLYRIDKRIEKH